MTLPQDYTAGPASATTGMPYGRRFAIDGSFISTGSTATITPKSAPPGIRMSDGSTSTQRIARGPSAPLELDRPLVWTLALPPLARETDRRLLMLAQAGGRTVTLYLERSIYNSWYAIAGQTQFSLSCRAAYGEITDPALGGPVSHASHPPRAWLNRVEQTVIASGGPSTGQVQIPDAADAQWRAVVTPALSAGDLLEVEFMPVHDVVIDARWSDPEVNRLEWSATVTERLTGRWD